MSESASRFLTITLCLFHEVTVATDCHDKDGCEKHGWMAAQFRSVFEIEYLHWVIFFIALFLGLIVFIPLCVMLCDQETKENLRKKNSKGKLLVV